MNLHNTNQDIDIFSGFSDDYLESLCKLKRKLFLPFVHWESEIYCIGKTLRAWAFYPSFIKLFFMTDHGVYLNSTVYPNELNNKTHFYFTWKSEKANRINKETKFTGYHLPHPWLFYKNKFFADKNLSRRGTLVFIPHSTPEWPVDYSELDSYILALKSLDEKYLPLVVCLDFRMIEAGLHKELRKHELPLVTFGAVENRDFVDRFYSTILNFNYATSSQVGSQTYFILEAGIPYFLFGEKVRYLREPKDKKVSLGVPTILPDCSLEKYYKFESDLYTRNDFVTDDQREIVSLFLGKDSKVSRLRGALLVWGTLLRLDTIFKFLFNEMINSAKFRFGKKTN